LDFLDTKNLIKDIASIILIVTVGIIFSRFGYFDYGDIGLAFMQNDMLLSLAKDNGISFAEMIKNIEPSYYPPTMYQHTYNYSLSVAIVHFVSRLAGFSSVNIAYVGIAVYFLTILAIYFLGKILIDREYGLLFSLLMAVSPIFNVATRTGSGIFYYTHIFYASCLLFLILAHKEKISLKKRNLCLTLCGIGVSLALFNGYPLAFITLPILIVFFILFLSAKLIQKFFPFEDQFLDRFHLLRIGSYFYLILIGVVAFFSISLMWDSYTGGEFFSTYERTIQGTLARQASLDVGWEEYINRAKNILYVLFVDGDKNGNFAYGGVHSDTAFPGQPHIPYYLAPFFLYGLIICFKNWNFVRIFFAAQFFMFVYVLLFHFQGWAPRVWFPMTFFTLMIGAEGFREVAKRYKTRFNRYLVVAGQGVLFLVLILNANSAVDKFSLDMGGAKGFNQGQMGIVKYLEGQKLGPKSLVIFIGDVSKYGWLRHIYINSKNSFKVVYQRESKDIFEKNKLVSLNKKFDSIYLVAQSSFYLMGNFGANHACLHCNNYPGGLFKKYPTLVPEKVIYSESERPLHYIFNFKDFLQEISQKAIISKDKNTFLFKTIAGAEARYVSYPLRRSLANQHSGSYSAELKKENSSNLIAYNSGPKIASSFYNKEVEFGAWVKAYDSDLAGMELNVLYEGGKKDVISSNFSGNNSRFHPGDGQWHLATIKKHFKTKPVAVQLKVFFNGLGEGVAYVDDVSCSVDGAPMVHLIPNPGFEAWDPSEAALTDHYPTFVDLEISEPKKIASKKNNSPPIRILPVGWSKGGEPVIYGPEGVNRVEGKYSLLFSGGITGVSNIAQPIDPKHFPKIGEHIEFKAVVKTKKAKLVRLQMGLLFSDDSYQEIYSQDHPGDGNWHELIVRKKINKPLKSMGVNITNRGTEKDMSYVDNAVITLDQKPGISVLRNGRFEDWGMPKKKTSINSQKKPFQMVTAGTFKLEEKLKEGGPLKRIHLQGQIQEMTFSRGQQKTVLPIHLSENMSAQLSAEKVEVLFKPSIPSMEANIFNISNLKFGDSYGEKYLQMEKGGKAELVFHFNFPFAIKQADIFSNPTIFNDMLKTNSFSVSYSTNGEDYAEIQQIRSNGNERYWRRSHPGVGGDHGESTRKGKDEYTTFQVIRPNSKSLFIKYNFANKYYIYRNSYLFLSHPEPWFRFVLDGADFIEFHQLLQSEKIEFIAKAGKPSAIYLVFDESNG